jgi:beta-mannosidase
MDPADLSPESPGFLARIKDEARKADAMISTVTGPARTLQDYVDFTQWTQAEGLKFGIEHFRRRTPHCSGALIWQFNDCWPCVSWSLVDYDGVQKASWYAVRRAFAPVLASFSRVNDQVELWITNDTLQTIAGTAEIALTRLDGRSEWCTQADFEAGPNASLVVWRADVATAADVVLTVGSTEGQFAPNRELLAPISALAFERGARPEMEVRQIGPRELQVRLSATTWLAFVHFVSDRPDLRFSDNYFDMAAGEGRTVTITADADLSPADIALRCWNDRTADA